MVHFSNLQPNLWKVELITVPLVQGQLLYQIPSRVVMILDAWVTVNATAPTSAQDLYITPVSRTEYASFSNKNTPGRPTCFWFQRTIPAQTVSMWPVPNTGNYILSYYACSQVQDTGLGGGETPDIPYLWLDAYVAGMSHRVARVYKPELEAIRKADAKEAWDIAAAQNTENVPTTLAPTISTYYRR